MEAPTLENDRAKLILLGMSNYKYLLAIAQQEKLIQFSPYKVDTPEDLKEYVQTAIDYYYHKTAIPFIIFDKKTSSYAGSTRFMNISWKNKVAEIGSTWIGREFQGTGLNTNMKFLMLQYAFEVLDFDRIEFRIDERNTPSRKAVEKLGAVYEGLLRKNIVMLDGFKRSTCCYSILKEEWPNIKQHLYQVIMNK